MDTIPTLSKLIGRTNDETPDERLAWAIRITGAIEIAKRGGDVDTRAEIAEIRATAEGQCREVIGHVTEVWARIIGQMIDERWGRIQTAKAQGVDLLAEWVVAAQGVLDVINSSARKRKDAIAALAWTDARLQTGLTKDEADAPKQAGDWSEEVVRARRIAQGKIEAWQAMDRTELRAEAERIVANPNALF